MEGWHEKDRIFGCGTNVAADAATDASIFVYGRPALGDDDCTFHGTTFAADRAGGAVMGQAQMLGHFGRPHDFRDRINQHTRLARRDAGKVGAHHARGSVRCDGRRTSDRSESLGCPADGIMRTSIGAVVATRATG